MRDDDAPVVDRSSLQLADLLAEISKSIRWCGRMRDQPQGHTFERLSVVQLQATLISAYLAVLRSTEVESEIRALQSMAARLRSKEEEA